MLLNVYTVDILNRGVISRGCRQIRSTFCNEKYVADKLNYITYKVINHSQGEWNLCNLKIKCDTLTPRSLGPRDDRRLTRVL